MKLTIALAIASMLALAPSVRAQSVSPSEREALVRLRVDRGGRADEVDALIRYANEAAANGLPSAPVTNKIREGLAKGADPKRIELVVQQMTANLESADRLMRELDSSPSAAVDGASVALLAESLGSGVTPDDVRALRSSGKAPLSGE